MKTLEILQVTIEEGILLIPLDLQSRALTCVRVPGLNCAYPWKKKGRLAFLQPRNLTTMAAPNVLNPHIPEFDRFLYASVGEDRNGYVVRVLSTLARLGLDPSKETAELVALGRDAA